MQFRQTVIYDRRQKVYRLRARMEGKGNLIIMIKMNSVPQGIEKIPDKDRTTRVGQMHSIVKETVTVPFDLGMWYQPS